MKRVLNRRLHTVNVSNITDMYGRYRFVIWFFIGIMAGTFCMNIFCDYFYDKLGIYSSYFRETYKSIDVENKSLFIYSVKDMILEVCLVIGLSLTSIGGLFLNFYCVYKGAVIALLISASVLKYGLGGVVIYAISILPHYITYGILLAIVINTGFYVWEKTKLFRKNRCLGGGLFDSIRLLVGEISGERKITLILLSLIGLILVTAFLEVYVNYNIISPGK